MATTMETSVVQRKKFPTLPRVKTTLREVKQLGANLSNTENAAPDNGGIQQVQHVVRYTQRVTFQQIFIQVQQLQATFKDFLGQPVAEGTHDPYLAYKTLLCNDCNV